QPQRHTSGQIQVAHVLEPRHEDGVSVTQVRIFGNAFADQLDGVGDLVQCVGRNVLRHSPGTDVGVVHAQPGDHLEDVQHQFAVAETTGHNRQRAQFHTAGGDG